MATQPRIARIRLDGAAGNFREWIATAAVQDTSAGQSVVITTTVTTGGAAPPEVADTLSLRMVTDTGVTINTFTLTPGSASQTSTFFFTNTGLTGGSARVGTVELVLVAVKTSGLASAQYNVESDGSPNTPPTGFTSILDRGWIRGTTTRTDSLSNIAAGGSKNSPFSYPDQVFQRAVLGAAPYKSENLTLTTGPLTGTASSSGATFDRTHTGVVDERFPAASAPYTTGVTVPNSALTGQPWTVLAATTTDSSPNARHGSLVGTNAPTMVASPFSGFGNAFDFEGIDRDSLTSGIRCPNIPLPANQPFTVEGRIRYDGHSPVGSGWLAGAWILDGEAVSSNDTKSWGLGVYGATVAQVGRAPFPTTA